MRRNNCRRSRIGLYFAAFGFGLLISMVCPNTVTVTVLSIGIVILGIIVSK